MKGHLRRILEQLRPPSLRQLYPEIDEAALEIIEAARPYTMTSPERLFSAIESARYVVRSNVVGAIVECGVWRGGSMIAMLHALARAGDVTRDAYLFDTYSGMTEPTEADRDRAGNLAETILSKSPKAPESVWAIATLEDVRQNVSATGYPAERVHFIRGRVEDTIPRAAPDEIAVLRLDTDWYESTRHELLHLYPRLRPGGVLIVDDYGHWEGARRAVDECLAGLERPPLLVRVDYTGRVAVKTL